jgi:hypothetical protein
MSLAPKWISETAFEAELKALGCAASDRQLERWRNAGLLRPRPRQNPNYRGSLVEHPATSARQVLAIERALAIKDRFEYAGAVLWAAGFEVDAKYWRPQLFKADRNFQHVVAVLRRFTRRDSDGPTIGDSVSSLDRMTGIVAKIFRRLPAEQFARAVNVAVEVISTDFETFEEPASDRDEFSTATAAQSAMDLLDGADDQIGGQRLKLAGALERVLADIAATHSEMGNEQFSDFEIQSARDDARNALKMAVCLHEALSWIYGPQAFGLRMAAFLGRTAPTAAIHTFALGLARLRRRSNQFYSNDEIAEMATQSEKVWLMAEYFKGLQLSRPELRFLIGPERLKSAFMDSREQEKLLKDLAGYEFPMPEFRPWDQWNKLSKKTMSPGLLAMSIGAPLKLDLADILPSASVAANP